MSALWDHCGLTLFLPPLLQGCTKTLTQVPSYIQIVGIILGMVTLGFVGDRIGRKWGSVTTASLMLLGAILLVSTSAPSQKGFVIFYIVRWVCWAVQVVQPALLLLLAWLRTSSVDECFGLLQSA